MALPKLDVPTYELILPLSEKKIKFRPFLVKEQRNLLMALESNDAESIQNCVRDVLDSCTLTEGINISKLPIIDIEYYFTQLRGKSVGEIIESKYKCNNEVNNEVCGNIMETTINLTELKVQKPENIAPEIALTDNIVIKLNYPLFEVVEKSIDIDNNTEVTFNMIADSIEYIYDGKQFYYASEAQPGEMLSFVEGMNQEQFDRVEKFFHDLPKLQHQLNMTCGKCGYHHEIMVEGLENFFV